nr:hypothetical protein [Tanacetum cinerariifolium]
MWEFKECSSCGALYTKSCACSKGGFIDKFVYKTPYSSQRPPQNCPKCGNPVDGLYCQHCDLLRKKLKEQKFSKDFLNTSESSNDDSNVQCTCKSCEKGAHYGYNCPSKVPIISNPKPCHDQNVEEFPQTLPSFHLTCYSGNENSFTYDSAPNLVKDYPNDSLIMGDEHFDTIPEKESNEFLKSSVENLVPNPSESEDELQTSGSGIFSLLAVATTFTGSGNSNLAVNAIIPVLPTEEPEHLLSMGYEHLNTILETESEEVIESSVKNLVQIPSEYEDTSDDESECDVPVKDESSQVFTTFLNHIFDDNDDLTSSDDELLSDEDVLMEDFKVYSKPLFDDEEINSDEIDPHYFNAESDLIESLSNHDTLMDSSSKFDYLEEFYGELMPTSIVDDERIRREHEEYISLMEKLFSIKSFPRSVENFHTNTIIETLPTSTIQVEDGDSFREEIDIFTSMDNLLPPSIESDDYDSEGISILLKD